MPSCAQFYESLMECLAESDCVMKKGNLPKVCLDKSHDDTVSKDCRLKQQAYFECKSRLLNPRTRMRGPYGYYPGDQKHDDVSSKS
ncbi:cytochrome c oxidase assembly protein PET191-domain-containing protein [Cladochytrium replicatum]|nr:cytochrome c oxidase assembly protein PET191-domain-containing protein [Cladochytrium replicatum]